jgi:hypothetical protein
MWLQKPVQRAVHDALRSKDHGVTGGSLVHSAPHINMTCRDVSEEHCRVSRDVGVLCFLSFRVSFSRVDGLTRIDKLTGASETPSNCANKETRLLWITHYPQTVTAVGQTNRRTETLLS